MHLPIKPLWRSLRSRIDHILGEETYGSDEEAIRSALALLYNYEREGAEIYREFLDSLVATIGQVTESLTQSHRELISEFTDLKEEIEKARGQENAISSENASAAYIKQFTQLIDRLTSDDTISSAVRGKITSAISRMECGVIDQLAQGRHVSARADAAPITRDLVSAYLSQRFNEPDLTVTDFKPLSGGFGKGTYLFSVAGSSLSGDFVLRRDLGAPVMDNDCHTVVKEFPLLKALHESGFPAPDALWLETDSHLLKGGDFIVMRRAPGAPGGDVWGSAAVISDDLHNVLASSLAKLHATPRLSQLDDLNESINAQLWSEPASVVVSKYIKGFRDLYLRDASTISPTLIAYFNWVLEHLPDDDAPSVLCHGDIGFHNMVMDKGELSVVVDWEYAHLGDPAEDLAYVLNTAGNTLDWDKFLKLYQDNGGRKVSQDRIKVFQVWNQLRNATSCMLALNSLAEGTIPELKFAHAGFYSYPRFLEAAERIIESY